MKRLLAILCTLALMLSVINPAVFAAENSSLQAAKDDDSFEIIVLEEDTSNLTVNRDTYLDLNGHDVSGVTVLGGTLYCLDSQTADYTVADGVYGHVTNITGNVKAAEGYLQVGDSFHAVNLDIYAMTLRASDVGVYYKSNFAADEVVAEQVESFGVALSVVTAPNADNLDSYCGYSEFTGFEAGEGANAIGTSTLLKGIMKAANGDEKNGKNAAMPVYGRAYIKTAAGYFFGETVKRSLQEQVEAIDGVWASLKDSQKAPVLGMLESYTAVMESWNIPNIQGIQVPGADTEIEIPIEVTAENGIVTEAVTVEQDGVSVTVPAGVKLAEGAEALTLTVTPKETSDTGIQLEKNEVLMPMDVHVEGLAADNTAPLTIYLGKVMAENLNMGNYAVYHVENGKANEMVLIPVDAEFTAHNQYKYTLDGELTLYMASFSEVAVVSDVNNAWEGKHDYTWYNADAETLYIRNADQLAGFGAIVGGMAEGIEQDDFTGKTVILLADISIGDTVADNGKVFYPIGYYNNQKSYTKTTGGSVSSNVSSFSGTFDGNGNTVSDFYQNTWEMFGDYNDGYSGTPNHYKDAMGLFGYVLNGTVKNLTVKNFSSDGEFTPTGVIAAYACNSTFENIAIVECNPRVYNTGNGGIIGIAGNNGDQDTEILLKNITVDKTNKISALWGSWDVACGGLVGMFRGNAEGGNGKIHFENCHVAAQIDVYNDVCANYQYYAYRYSGMMIGSVRHNQTIDGHVYPNMTGISASGCTVHFGDWNDYYYCELVANTTASYTHDHQMSRLVQVASVDAANMQYVPLGETEPVAIPSEGRVNYVVVNTFDAETQMWVHGDGHDYAECYHFVNGTVWNHEDAGSHDNPFIDENGDDVADLKEDKQLIYREFNNLFTGYGWGVTTKAISDFAEEDIRILDKALDGGSADKFLQSEEFRGEEPYPAGAEIRLEDLFQVNDAQNIDIIGANVQVTVSPVDENGTVKATYTPNYTDWTKGTLTFDKDFEGAALVTITDYYFCNPLTLTVNVTKYTADLYFEDGTDAYCPVCEAVVTWTAADPATVYGSGVLTNGSHLYLNTDVIYDKADDENAYWLNTPGGSRSACFHLNGHGVEITIDEAFVGNFGGYINVMGTGTVTKTTGTGNGVFQTNTAAKTCGVEIYGGNYVAESGYVFYVRGNGGEFGAHKGVTLTANGGTAIYVGKGGFRQSRVTLEGVIVEGDITIATPATTATQSETTSAQDSWGNTYVTLADTTVNGTVTANNNGLAEGKVFAFTVSGSTSISCVKLNNEAKLTLGEMTDGAMIGVSATVDSPFTVENTNAAAYRKYFYASVGGQIVKVEGEQLVCKAQTYADALEFHPDGTAWCMACKANVEWEDVSNVPTVVGPEGRRDHYYVPENMTLSTDKMTFYIEDQNGNDTNAANILCLHLNGNTLTLKKSIYVGFSSTVNIMGGGQVVGAASNSIFVVYSGTLNLYSSTYNAGNNGKTARMERTASKINLYENASVQGEFAMAMGELWLYDAATMSDLNITGGLTTFCDGWTGSAKLTVDDSLLTDGVVSTSNAKVESTADYTITSVAGDVTVNTETGAITIATASAEE